MVVPRRRRLHVAVEEKSERRQCGISSLRVRKGTAGLQRGTVVERQESVIILVLAPVTVAA